MNNNILMLIAVVTTILSAPIIINQSGIPMHLNKQTGEYEEVITPYHTYQEILLQQYAYGSGEKHDSWAEKVKTCTDIYQNEYDLDGYYACWAELDKGLEGQ